MVFIVTCVVLQNVSTRANLDHVLKVGINDEVNHVGVYLSKIKLDTTISLFCKLKMITRAVVWEQVRAERCVARTIICSRKKVLKSSYEILTGSFTKFEKRFCKISVSCPHKQPLGLGCGA